MMRAFGGERTPLAALSRAKVGIRGESLIINLPGSARAVCESLDALLPWIFHIFPMLRGEQSPHHHP
ncbi:MAG TPA: hypothetical protein EYP10_03185 [Armatimonadetes bacterium]|nr:hypothetical protein [Armatimonadota bacterium]